MTGDLYRPWNPGQGMLFPPNPMDWLPGNHAVYRIMDIVSTLDISEIERKVQDRDSRGNKPYHPGMMVALLIWAYSNGVYASRAIQKATYEQIPFRVVTGNQHPHFTRIAAFRAEHHEAFVGLYLQVLALCQKLGMVKLGNVALDGTKIQGNASKHKAMSYERMVKEEARLQREIEALMSKAAEADQGLFEDSEEDIPAELERREKRLERISIAKAELEEEARQARAATLSERARKQREKEANPQLNPTERKRSKSRAERNEQKARDLLGGSNDDNQDPPDNGTGPGELPSHKVKTNTDGSPAPSAQRNFTDPDSRIMPRDGTFLQGYNCQIAVDRDSSVIVAQAVTNQAPDQEHLIPMLHQIDENLGTVPEILTADTGYYSAEGAENCERLGVNALIALKRGEPDAHDSRNPNESEAKRRMREKLESTSGRAAYAQRKWIVEPVFGIIKDARRFKRFSLRGVKKVRGEWTLICLCHNLLKVIAAGQFPSISTYKTLSVDALRVLKDLSARIASIVPIYAQSPVSPPTGRWTFTCLCLCLVLGPLLSPSSLCATSS